MAATPTPFSWTSLKGRTVIREVIEERIPEWRTGPRPAQLDCWSHTLAGIPTILIASTGWGKTTAFFVPILVLQHLAKYPKPQIPKPPQRPVALVVTPLIELGKAHVSPSIQYKCNT
jgi:superfamily II DNA/RNA helicase